LHIKKNIDLKAKNKQDKKHKTFTTKRRIEEEAAATASPKTVFRTSSFKLVGETKITMHSARNGKYDLTKVPANCPIDGTLQMHFSCEPQFTANASGFLTLLEDVGGYTSWNRRWCSLTDHKILYWKYPDEAGTKEPLGAIDLRYAFCKQVDTLPRDTCARPHTFELVIRRPVLNEDQPNLIATIEGKHLILKYWMCADNKDDRHTWMSTINRQLADARAWTAKRSSSSNGKTPIQV